MSPTLNITLCTMMVFVALAQGTNYADYRIGATNVTIVQFAQFIDATCDETEAERFGWSFVFWR